MAKERIRIGDAAEMLGISVGTLRNWDREGKLKPVQVIGKQRWYSEAQIVAFLAQAVSK